MTGIDISPAMLARARRRLSPLLQRAIGPAVNRRTEDNARAAGLDLVEVRRRDELHPHETIAIDLRRAS